MIAGTTVRKNERFGSQKAFVPRSQLVINLRKLVDLMDIDLLSASLGIRESMLRDILSGKDNGDDYRQFLSQKLDEAGFTHNWLDRSNAQIFPDQIKELRLLASSSAHKAPLRRDNLKTLMAAFDGKLDILADALEVVPNALLKVAQGELVLDDQRFGHFNPVLMRAGFPDGWLDSAQAKIEAKWTEKLTAMAMDQCEAYLSKMDVPPPKQLPAISVNAPNPQKTNSIIVSLPSSSTLSERTPIMPVSFLETKSQPSTKGQAPGSSLTSLASQLAGKAPPVLRGATSPAPLPDLNSPKLPLNVGAIKGAHTLQAIPEVPAVSVKAAAPLAPTPHETMSETSVEKLRTQRLEALLEKGRRGIRSYLWVDCLKKSLAFSYSLDKGKVAFTDQLAQEITKALGLPAGWLDTANAPITLAAPWVFDKTTGFPSLDGDSFAQTQATASTTLPAPLKKISQLKPLPKPMAEKPQVAQVAQTSAPEVQQPLPFSAEQKQEEPITAPAAIVAQPVLRAAIQSPSEVRAPAIAAHAPPPASVPLSVAVAAPPVAASEQASPPPSFLEVPAGELGPLARVLLHTIELQARQGKLTEKQALEIIYKIS